MILIIILWKRHIICLGFLLLFFSDFYSALAKQPDLPTPINNVLGEGIGSLDAPTPGTWYVGDESNAIKSKKAPILFIQGRRQSARAWWSKTYFYGPNDMYSLAYNAGYPTAFLESYDSLGSGFDQFKNGKIIAKQLKEMYKYFGQKINVIAFSRGGVDIQTALVHYGAYNYVDKVVTLGSPHYGTHLADLANSWYMRKLATYLGLLDEGMKSVQIANMEIFREETDGNKNINKNSYYTASGTNHGPFPLSLGGFYLSPYGDNDGLVNVWSTQLPNGTELFSRDLDHDNIRIGNLSFSEIDALFSGSSLGSKWVKPKYSKDRDTYDSSREISQTPSSYDNYMYGDQLLANQEFEHSFSIDSSNDAKLMLFANSDKLKVRVASPSGKSYLLKGRKLASIGDVDPVGGASLYKVDLPSPEVGTWTVQLESARDDSFVLLCNFGSSEENNMSLGVSNNISGNLALKLKNSNLLGDRLSITSRVISPDGKQSVFRSSGRQIAIQNSLFSTNLNIKDLGPGAHNITFDIDGYTKSGKHYQRTVVKSIYVK